MGQIAYMGLFGAVLGPYTVLYSPIYRAPYTVLYIPIYRALYTVLYIPIGYAVFIAIKPLRGVGVYGVHRTVCYVTSRKGQKTAFFATGPNRRKGAVLLNLGHLCGVWVYGVHGTYVLFVPFRAILGRFGPFLAQNSLFYA